MAAPIGGKPTGPEFVNQHQFAKEAGQVPGGFPHQKIFDAKRSCDFNADKTFADASSKKINDNIRRFIY